ncbi:hypothetical protein OG497_06265 [Streptomyces sp. NBC_01242]|nr:hypothetical protein [Streptomyces sp. NBC_01242]MCX4793756.1 hypothetical protein [Streptomyces sp. NBC_01242]
MTVLRLWRNYATLCLRFEISFLWPAHPDWTADRLKQVLVSTAKQGLYAA